MSSTQRPILPAPLTNPEAESVLPQDDHIYAPVIRKRTVISVACKSCRSRRSKCDGLRPICQPCKMQGVHCEYDLEISPGQTRAAGIKAKMEMLTKDNTSMLEVLWYLQTKPAEEARHFLEQLRLGASLESLSKLARDLEPAGEVSLIDPVPKVLRDARALDVTNSNVVDSLESDDAIRPNRIINPATGLDAIEAIKALRSVSISTVRTATNVFFQRTGQLFYIFSLDQVNEVLDKLVGDDLDEDSLLIDVLKESSSIQSGASICELCGMAAIGVLYMRVDDSDGSAALELADGLYSISKHFLDNSIEAEPLRAMKACTLLAMYNIVLHATVALAYIEMGTSLWRAHAINQFDCPPGTSIEVWTDHKRTLRTLALLEGWMSATLGFLPKNNAIHISTASSKSSNTCREWESARLIRLKLQVLHENEHLSPEETVQQQMAKITIIKGNILRMIGRSVSGPTVRKLQDDLQDFHDLLPGWMTLSQLTSSSEVPLMLRNISFYVHLFYLSALMLLHRLILRNMEYADQPVSTNSSTQEAQKAVVEGLLAAKTAARILQLLLAEGSVVKICWLSIYTAYTACVIILYGTVQKILYGYQKPYWSADLEAASICINVLRYCGETDPLSSRFQHIIQVYQDILEAKRFDDELGIDESPLQRHDVELPADCLFVLPLGNSDLHIVSRDLLKLTQRPFQDPLLWKPSAISPGPTIQETLINVEESMMGTHLEWSWEINHSFTEQSGHENKLACNTASVVSDEQETSERQTSFQLEIGQFLRSSEASGWST